MIYDYKCKSCTKAWEESLPISKVDEPIKKRCPHCNACKGNVFRYFPSAPSMKMDANYKVDQPHNEGGFQDAMRRMIESPGVKGTPEAEIIKAKHLS